MKHPNKNNNGYKEGKAKNSNCPYPPYKAYEGSRCIAPPTLILLLEVTGHLHFPAALLPEIIQVPIQ
jgi:hypothetical protein